MLQKIRWVILILGIIVLMTAMVQNSDPVQLRFFRYETELPTSILLLVVLIIGFLVGMITAIWLLRRRETAKRKVDSATEPSLAPTPIEPAAADPTDTGRSKPLGSKALGSKQQG
jgi:uncharacterized integral membrane protein